MSKVENIDEAVVAADLERAFGENPATSDGEKCLTSLDIEESLSEGGSDNQNSQTYYFGSPTITVDNDNAVVYAEFLSLACTCLCI
jgi:hypothetical protein